MKGAIFDPFSSYGVDCMLGKGDGHPAETLRLDLEEVREARNGLAARGHDEEAMYDTDTAVIHAWRKLQAA